MSLPDDAITLAEAARISERTPTTIRRWIAAGRLERFEGPMPEHGGSPKAFVKKGELMGLLAESGQAPRAPVDAGDQTSKPPEQLGVDAAENEGPTQAVMIARLEGEVIAGQLREEIARAEGKLEAIQAELAAESKLKNAAENRAEELKLQLREAGEEIKALRAENRALRAQAGLSWFQRLIGVRPAIEAEDEG